MGIESFFPVQVATWLETVGPGAFQRDICINSPTGSGKTLAYALPIVQMLSSESMVPACFGRATYAGLGVAGLCSFFVPCRNLCVIAHVVNSNASNLSFSY
jgi:superfamily II DNA/RNA helicase